MFYIFELFLLYFFSINPYILSYMQNISEPIKLNRVTSVKVKYFHNPNIGLPFGLEPLF